MGTSTYGAQPAMVQSSSFSSEINPQPPADELYMATFFCRAMYDYQTNDTSSLSFRKNDIIEVLTRLESGWWDGLLGDERGWFPSNYVTVISDQEAEAALSELSGSQQPLPDDSMVDIAHGMSRTLSQSGSDVAWLDREVEYPAPSYTQNDHSIGVNGTATKHSDFWVPQVSQDGQIFYVNTQTGQHSRDLPQELEDDADGEVGGFVQSASRPGPSVLSPGAAAMTLNGTDNANPAGFGLPRRSETPEPWLRRLADDGLSYYYQNKVTGQISRTQPETHSLRHDDNSVSGPNLITSTPSSSVASSQADRTRSDSSASRTRERSYSAADRFSISSDDSDVHPRQYGDRSGAHVRAAQPVNGTHRERLERPSADSMDLTSAEQTAKALQQALCLASPETSIELSNHVREAIAAVVEYLQSTGPNRRPEQCKQVDQQVLAVVAAVRNLLYVTATPTGHIPTHLYPRNLYDTRSSSTAQALQTHLKASHRKVAGTLSKLVLSSLAMQYEPLSSAGDKPNRMESDATELERSVAAFVLEVQRFEDQHAAPQEQKVKRLQATLLATNIGLGLPGAGAAASWKGLGYVASRENAPQRALDLRILSELKQASGVLDRRLGAWLALSTEADPGSDRVQSEVQTIVALLNSITTSVGDINVAQHVDVDGVRGVPDYTLNHSQYAQSVERARLLLRTLEVAMQCLYDDSSAVLMTAQSSWLLDRSQHQEAIYARYDHVDALVTALKANMGVVLSTLEALLAVGHDQAVVGHAVYKQSIEWRRSRSSSIASLVDGIASEDQAEDVVDFEVAFSKPGTRNLGSLESSSSSSKPYYSSTQVSETSLDMSDRTHSEDGAEPITPTWPLHEASSGTLVAPHSPSMDPVDLEEGSGALFDEDGPSSSKSPPRAAKLIQFFGTEAPKHIISKLNADAKPWYLRPNYDPSEILIDPDGGVRAGTASAMVERLTAHEHGDPTFSQNFLMTFKSFMTLDELFDLLVRRFFIQPPDGLGAAELEEWTKFKQLVIRMRVLNTFKAMVTDDDVLEKEDMYILDRMKEFATNSEVSNVAGNAARQLLVNIERTQRGGDAPIKTTNTMPIAPPPPIVPRSSRNLKLLDIDPLELARQLTLMEATLYKKIRPMECLTRSREQKPGKNNDNITSIIQLSNRIANWVAESVLSKEDSRKRAAVVKHFIGLADRCRGLQNFSTMTAVISGLNTPPIRRLKRTWEQVNARFMAQLSTCEATIDTNKNFNNYRQTLARITPPCVPFIGVYLTTLTFINDGAEDKLTGDMINFRKRQKAAEVIQDIKRWQSKPYNFQTVATVLGYLEESFTKYVDGVDYGDQFWHLSLEREPREREDEKMARLLQESGFL